MNAVRLSAHRNECRSPVPLAGEAAPKARLRATLRHRLKDFHQLAPPLHLLPQRAGQRKLLAPLSTRRKAIDRPLGFLSLVARETPGNLPIARDEIGIVRHAFGECDEKLAAFVIRADIGCRIEDGA